MSNDAKFAVPAAQRQLFVDDHGVAAVENLVRTLHQPSKKGAVIRPDFTRGQHNVQTRSAPHWNPRLQAYRIVAEGRWYESADGLHWTPAGAELQPRDMVPLAHALYDPADPDPGRRFKGLTSHVINVDTGGRVQHSSERVDAEGKPWPGKRFERYLDFLVSSDGIDWIRLDARLSSFDEWNLSYDPLDKQYILCFKKTGTYGRSHMISTSPDFEIWSEPVLAIQSDDLDQELGRLHIEEFLQSANADYLKPFPNTPEWHWQNVDIYNAGVFRYEGIFLALPAIYHARGARWSSHTLRFTLIQLWCSRDLHNWERVADRRAFIPWSPMHSGAYDLNKNLPPSYPVVRGDELWFYYSGRKESSVHPDPDPDIGAICLAVLRRDGFVSLDAAGEEGRVLTEPFIVPAAELWVNVDVRNGEGSAGYLRAEVLGEDDKVLAASVPIDGDRPRVKVCWQEGNMAAHQGKVVRLRFILEAARFYSYWFE
jgi:hypothetical protein